MESPSDTKRATEQIAAGASRTLNRPYAFAMASISALFLALVGLLGQLATRELSVFPALFMRYLASTLVILIVLRGAALQTLRRVSRLDYLRVGSVLISQFCLFYYLAHGSLLIGMLLYNTGPLFSPLLARWVLGITFGLRTVTSILLGFAGVALVLNPFGERMNAIVLVALASGFFNSCSQLAFHQMSRDEAGPLESLFPFYVLLTVCSIAPLPFVSEQTILAFERLRQWEMVAQIIGMGVFGVLNQSAKSLAYRNVRNPANLGPFLYLSLVAAAFFDWILYGQVPTSETLLGGTLILASALTILFGTLKRHGISHQPIP
jgi:drug/metabolite transporter (DMT)-like permease